MKSAVSFFLPRVSFALAFIGCVTFLQAQEVASADNTKKVAEISDAVGLIEANCNSCHMPAGKGEKRLAPPMQMVKQHYISDFDNQQSFTTAIVDYVLAPDESKSKMKGARNKFGLMPAQSLPKEDLQKIAEYLYITDLGPVSGHHGKGSHGEKGLHKEKECSGNCGDKKTKEKGGCGGCGGSCDHGSH